MDRSSSNPGAPQPAGTRVAAAPARILRACVVQGGKVIEEQRLRRREPLSVGRGPKNTFVISDPSLPKSHELFAIRGSQYELVLTEGMRGRLSVDNKTVDFASLKAQGLLKKKGDFYRLPLNENHRGKVLIGDLTLIFQFVVPPPAPVKPVLPVAARGNILKTIDWPFAIALFAIWLIEAPMVTYFQFAKAPADLTLDDISKDERWAKLIVPERKEEEKKPEKSKGDSTAEQRKAAKKSDDSADDAKDEVSKARAKAARTAKIRESIQGRGMLAVLGSAGDGPGSGAVADVFGEGGIGGDLDGAFDGIQGVGIATGSGDRSTRGGGSGDAATIADLATQGGGSVDMGTKRETRVGRVTTEGPEVDGKLDSEAVAKEVRKRMRMVQDCYEKELKRDPALSGKIEIEFTIGEDGRVVDARVASNKMDSDAVGECIVSRLRHWKFPQPDGGSVTVNFPFIFAPSS